MERPFAVEVNVSQAKRLGFSANAYIVAGEPVLYKFQNFAEETAEKCEVTTNKAKNTVMALVRTDVPVGDCRPRPKVEAGWEAVDGVWSYDGASVLS